MDVGKKRKAVPTFRLKPASLMGSEQGVGSVIYGGNKLGAGVKTTIPNQLGHVGNDDLAGENAAWGNDVQPPDTIDVTHNLSNVMSPVLSSMSSIPVAVLELVTPSPGLDMSMTELTDAKRRNHIRNCVKLRVFRKLKFFVKMFHSDYTEDPHTVCADMMRYCKIVPGTDYARLWWLETRVLVMRTHTDHRNNCIKAMRLRYRGKCFVFAIVYPVELNVPRVANTAQIPEHLRWRQLGLRESDTDPARLLQMRQNIVNYTVFIDDYAPCVVSSRVWNNNANMEDFCSTTDPVLFNDKVLSQSDEAFMLLVFINYVARWEQELVRDKRMVRCIE